ncbi:MAG: Ig-like domain-containing protein, partial [Oscillospiraceae bacterium]|nr:Ig-like domain-containing protein [Oscillospiraceae bacterium]
MKKIFRRLIGYALALLLVFPAGGVMAVAVPSAQVHQVTTWQQVNGASADIWLTFIDGDTLDFSAAPPMDAVQLVIPESVTDITLIGDSERVLTPFSLRAMGAVNITLHDFHFQTPATGNTTGIVFTAGMQNQIYLVGTNSIVTRGGGHGITGDVAFYGSGALAISASAGANGSTGGRQWNNSNTRADGLTGGVGQTGANGVVGMVHFNHTGEITITGGRGGNGGRGGAGFGSTTGGSGNGGHGGRGGNGGFGILGDVFATGSGTVNITGGNGGSGGHGGDGMSPAGLVGGGGRGGNGGNSGNSMPAINGNVMVDDGYAIFLTAGQLGWYGSPGRPTTSSVHGQNGVATGIVPSTVTPNWGNHSVGYTQRGWATITIVNNENRTVTLNPLPNVPNWTLIEGVGWSTPFAPNESRTFQLRPNNDLPVGTYNPAILITGDGVSTMVRPIFIVSLPILVTDVTIAGAATRTLTVGATLHLLATVSPWNATNRAVTWSSSNTAVATVSADGLVTASASTAGTATITATAADGPTASVVVTVNTIPVTSVRIGPGGATHNLNVNQTVRLNATISPLNATNQAVTWSSSNTNIATVNASGLVTARAAGTATITVRTADGNRTASVTVTV